MEAIAGDPAQASASLGVRRQIIHSSLRRRIVSLAQFRICLSHHHLDGASKTWAMTGWRLGFTANRALAPVFTPW